MKNTEFIINGKLYSIEDSLLLYDGSDGTDIDFTKVAMYYTSKGAFFTVKTSPCEKTEVEVIDRKNALRFFNENPAGIINENYIKVFGKVEKG